MKNKIKGTVKIEHNGSYEFIRFKPLNSEDPEIELSNLFRYFENQLIEITVKPIKGYVSYWNCYGVN